LTHPKRKKTWTSTETHQPTISAIKSLKIGEALDLDNLNAELFKVNPGFAADILLPLSTEIWEVEKVPKD